MSPCALAIVRIAYGILWLQQAMWGVPPDFGVAGDLTPAAGVERPWVRALGLIT